MITTEAYNDFSSFSYEEKHNPEFMLEQLREFHKKGGDVSLMVRADGYRHELISFRDFIMKNLDNPEKFFQQLMSEGILPGICDFEWDDKTGTITEKKEYGLNWMKQNYDKFEDMIKGSISNLLKKIPDDTSKISNYVSYDYYGKPEIHKYQHPLFLIAETLEKPEIYDLIFTAKPQVKKEWLKSRRTSEDQPHFINSIGAIWGDLRNPITALIFYKHDICKKYLHKSENIEKLHELIKYAAWNGDIEILKEVLPKVKLKEMEKNKYAHDLSLTRADSPEIAKLLIENGAVIEQKIKGKNDNYTHEVNVLFSDELRKYEVFETILESEPKYKKLITTNPEDFYTGIIEKKPFEFTKLLVEKYNFPLEKFDMLYIAYKKNNSDLYNWLLKNGADIRECESFCSSLVSAREEGLKTIRALNKEGIIVAKSPDMVFNIFNSNPTKIFINYYDKLTDVDLEKYTKKGLPVWWGATQSTEYSFMYSRIKNFTQTAQDGMPLLFYCLQRQLSERKGISPKEAFKMQIDKITKKDPSYMFDFSYTDSNGNNIMHLLLKTKEYRKDEIDVDLLKLIKEKSQQDIYQLLKQKNNEGITPLENLLIPETNKIINNWSYQQALKLIFNEEDIKKINFSEKLTNGSTAKDLVLQHFKDDSELTRIHAAILDNEMQKKDNVANKKIKI